MALLRFHWKVTIANPKVGKSVGAHDSVQTRHFGIELSLEREEFLEYLEPRDVPIGALHI